MANPNDLEKLCQGAKVWNAWREKNPDTLPDLTDADLTLSQRQFGPTSGGPINLRGVNLSGATLRYATLSGADLEDAILAGADLVHARLDEANLTGADLTDAICDNADLAKAKLDDAVLTGTSFANTRNLTEDQIAFAHGDATTLLPVALMPPASWFPGGEDGIYPEYPVPDQMMDVDLYEVLGVDPTAKQGDIRTAFRNLVKKLHPDVNPDDDEAQESFKRVSTAYRILSDPQKRARYDKGEIGSDGEINPEFEAKRQFRRYAFRFYAAAAMSLLLAAGVLGVVWHAVLTDDGSGRGRVEIAVATPPKSSERLDAGEVAGSDLRVDFRRRPELGSVESADDAAEAKTEVLRGPLLGTDPSSGAVDDKAGQPAAVRDEAQGEAAKGKQAEAAAPKEILGRQASLPVEAAVKDVPGSGATEKRQESGTGIATPNVEQVAASNQHIAAAGPQATQVEPISGSPSEPPAPAANVPDTKNVDGQNPAPPSASAPPGTEAPPAAAQSVPPPDAKVTTRPLFEEHKGEQSRPAQADAARADAPASQASSGVPYANRAQPPRNDAFMRKTEGRKGTRDAISALFRQRAVKQTMAQDQPQATASMGPLAPRDESDAPEEVWDIYTHSIPDTGAEATGPWSGFPEGTKNARREMRPAKRDIMAKVPAQEGHPATASRKQAVSDILAGGL